MNNYDNQNPYIDYSKNGEYPVNNEPVNYPPPNYPPQEFPPQNYPPQDYPPQDYNMPYPAYAPYPIQKKPRNTGLIVFAIIACIVAFLCVIGFCVSIAYSFFSNFGNTTGSGYSNYGYYGDGFEYYYDDDEDYFSTPEQTPDTEEDSESTTEENQSFVTPDIDVEPYTDGITINEQPDAEELSPNEVYEKVVVSTVTITSQVLQTDGSYEEGTGTGIIITSDGYILTNSHVVNDSLSTYVTIATSDGDEYPAVVVGYDKATDIAIIKTEDHDFTPAEFGSSDDMEMGDWVMAIGSPGGTSYTGSVTRGVISGLDRTVGYSTDDTMTYIQTDAAINPGNSGGPLVNMYGQVIGINTSKIVADYFEGMGFAIPISDAESIINSLLENGYASDRVRLGITATEIDSTTSLMYGVPTGVMIYTIDDDSSFVGTDAMIGDIITHFEGEEVTDLTQLSQLFLSYSPGDVVEVTLYRIDEEGNGSELTIEITLLADNGETQG